MVPMSDLSFPSLVISHSCRFLWLWMLLGRLFERLAGSQGKGKLQRSILQIASIEGATELDVSD